MKNYFLIFALLWITIRVFGQSTYSLSGNFSYFNGSSTPTDILKVILKQDTVRIDSTMTSEAGYYQFEGLANNTYTTEIFCSKPWNGVNGTDAIKIQRHFAGLELLTEPVKIKAADVNKSESVNGTDAVKVKRRFAGMDTTYVRGDWTFAKPTAGGDTIIINGADVVQNFYILCVGDINGSYTPSPTLELPVVTTDIATNISPSSAISGGNVFSSGGAVVTARGVCWGTITNPTIADNLTPAGGGTGIFVSSLAGLNSSTLYHIRAYATNSVGTSYGNDLTFTTGFVCLDTITVTHVAGDIAPVTKTVTYGTVNNIPGATSKCWITSNLGADRQATALDDDTEASAGWYWQFNRKQGYKHTGTTRTPNANWIYPIDEDSDYLPANDPCALELGNGWRIPTKTEWTSVDAAGNWTNSNGPWNSDLKLHAAGFLDITGELQLRGSFGYYLSSTQANNSFMWVLLSRDTKCLMLQSDKANGWAIRCIRDSINPAVPTVTTTAATNILTTTASGGGTVQADGGASVTERGVCWSTSSNPTIANSHTTDGSGTGVFVSSLTGLIPNTPYHIRAYATNGAGTAYGENVSFTTLAFTCGSTITINHLAGAVAPVTKTVTYGTVTNIPGELSKCWITSNLGADHQATAVNDASEASAGWYWQFNHKQGYKHDGAIRTPNDTWIANISEDSDWIAANDPCTLELGSGWRVPAQSDWTNLDASGNWTNWNGPWNSELRLHAAGSMSSTEGLLYGRGTVGTSWASGQADLTHINYMRFGSGYSYLESGIKSSAYSIRCLRE